MSNRKPLLVFIGGVKDFHTLRLGLQDMLHFLSLGLGVIQFPGLQAQPLLTTTLVPNIERWNLSGFGNSPTLAWGKHGCIADVGFLLFIADLLLAVINNDFEGS